MTHTCCKIFFLLGRFTSFLANGEARVFACRSVGGEVIGDSWYVKPSNWSGVSPLKMLTKSFTMPSAHCRVLSVASPLKWHPVYPFLINGLTKHGVQWTGQSWRKVPRRRVQSVPRPSVMNVAHCPYLFGVGWTLPAIPSYSELLPSIWVGGLGKIL